MKIYQSLVLLPIMAIKWTANDDEANIIFYDGEKFAEYESDLARTKKSKLVVTEEGDLVEISAVR